MKRSVRNRMFGQWKQLEGEVCTRWSKLTVSDFKQVGGQREKLTDVLQQRYGMAYEEATRQVEEFAANLR